MGLTHTFIKILVLVFVLMACFGSWKIFVKAQYPGWCAIVPFYNFYIYTKIVEFSPWTMILIFIPWVNVLANFYFWFHVAKKFGKSNTFSVATALLPFIFVLFLGLDKSEYQKPL